MTTNSTLPEGINGSGAEDLLPSEEDILQEISKGIADAIVGDNQGSVTRAGMDLSAGGDFKINSIFDLVDARVDAIVEGAPQNLISPWSSDAGSMLDYLPELIDAFGIVTDQWIEGRIDINQARYETLMGIPTMTDEIARAIVASKAIGPAGDQLDDVYLRHSTNGWLMIDGLVDLATMRQLDPYITTKGDIFQAQIVGYFISQADSSGNGSNTAISSRVNVFIDGSENPPRITSYSDYSELGVAHPLREWQGIGQEGR